MDALPADDVQEWQWRYDPWRERPRVAWAAAAIALALCLLVVSMREHPIFTIGLCLFCVSAFSPALTPVECRLDAKEVRRRALWGWESRAWSSIQRVEELPAGAFVSPQIRSQWWNAYRGLSLPMPAGERARLTAEIRRRVATHGR